MSTRQAWRPAPRRSASIWFHVGGHLLLGEARNHLIAIGDVPDGGGDYGGGSLHVVGNDALIGIETAVGRERVVLDGVLLEAYAGQARVVEGSAVGAAGGAAVGDADAEHAPIGEVREH